MKLEAYSVFDQAVGAFASPQFVRSRLEAVRLFAAACRHGSDHQFAAHPQDFSLHHVGEWDDESGELTSVKPERVITAVQCQAEGKLQ